MEQAREAIKLGATLADEYHLSPDRNSFTAAHPDAYFYGVFCACTGRPLPEREQARRSGHAPGAHAYEVLKLGFADASNALGRPVLVQIKGAKEEPFTPKIALPDLQLRDRLMPHGRPSALLMFLLIVALAVALFLLQMAAKGRRVGLPYPGQETEAPADDGHTVPDGSI